MRIVFGLFLMAHGLVHALYVGHAMRLFEVKPGMAWPDGSWALSGLMGDSAVRGLVAVVFSLAAVGFAVTGIALMLRQPWWELTAAATAAISTVMIVLAWDGQFVGLDGQGLYAVMINLVVAVSALALHWPELTR